MLDLGFFFENKKKFEEKVRETTWLSRAENGTEVTQETQ